MTGSERYDNGSLWFATLGAPAHHPEPAAPPSRTDVAIIGGGYTGLWTAYYLKQAAPELDVTVLEAEVVGFGASGRNGGWCVGAAWGVERLLEDPATRSRGIALQRALFDSVDEVGRVCQAEDIDCHYAKGGTLRVATLPFHADRQQRELARWYEMGFSEDDFRWLPAHTARERVGLMPNFGAIHARHCAAVHPARLARGLAQTVSRLGVQVVEQCPVLDYAAGTLTTAAGQTAATTVIRATEAYTASLPGHGRDLLPLYSMMVATEPLDPQLWEVIGLHQRETFGDDRRLVIYGQRTLDGRLAFGGRAGYRYGSRRYRVVPPEVPALNRVAATLRDLFPPLQDVAITHRWGGVLAVPRHWRPCVAFDRASRVGWAGGYVGEGVAASNLAARILADLILERTTELTTLPWVDDVPRRWEPEPFRWLGARALQWLAERADRSEFRRARPSRFYGGLFSALSG